MPSVKRKFFALALITAFVAPALSADQGIPGAGVNQSTEATRVDAVSTRTTARESGRMKESSTTEVKATAPADLPAPAPVLTRDDWLQLDANSDGKLSASEVAANAGISSAFAVMDSNGDGLVTQAEYSAYRKARR